MNEYGHVGLKISIGQTLTPLTFTAARSVLLVPLQLLKLRAML